MGSKQFLIVVCLFLVGICFGGYVFNTPIALNAEQETAVVGGQLEFIDTDCQDGTGGCTPSGTRPAVIPCPPNVSVGGLCNQPSWSTDSTVNRVCSTTGDWTWLPGLVCSMIDPYSCKRNFTTCLSTGNCSGTTTATGPDTATRCQN
jgi:hypothetical protein